MSKAIRALASASLPLAAVLLFSFSTRAQQAPKELQPPAGEQLVAQVHAKGGQVYTCKAEGGQFAWTLKAPDARLSDKMGKPFGKHFAGPSWEANDGSRVTGKAVANAPSPDADAIPWLLVTVVNRSGDGVLARVTSIQRVNTRGGKAPGTGCDAAHSDQEYRAPYSAAVIIIAARRHRGEQASVGSRGATGGGDAWSFVCALPRIAAS